MYGVYELNVDVKCIKCTFSLQLFGWTTESREESVGRVESMPSEVSLGSSETGLAAPAAEKATSSSSSSSSSSASASAAGARTRLWQDGVLAQLVRAAQRLEADTQRFRDEFYNPKSYANLLGAVSGAPTNSASPPELQIWLHLDGLAAHSGTFRQMLTGHSMQLANGELLPTGPSLVFLLFSCCFIRNNAFEIYHLTSHSHSN